MVDRYTKIVLTVIASALCALVVQNMFVPARAVGDSCGEWHNPCMVEVRGTVAVEGDVSVQDPVEVFGTVWTR